MVKYSITHDPELAWEEAEKFARMTPTIFYTIFEGYNDGAFLHEDVFRKIYADGVSDRQFLKKVGDLGLLDQWGEFVSEVISTRPEYVSDLEEYTYEDKLSCVIGAMLAGCDHGNLFAVYENGAETPTDLVLIDKSCFDERIEVFTGHTNTAWGYASLDEDTFLFETQNKGQVIFKKFTHYLCEIGVTNPLTNAEVDLDKQLAKNNTKADMLVDWVRNNLLATDMSGTEEVFAEEIREIEGIVERSIHCAKYAHMIGPG